MEVFIKQISDNLFYVSHSIINGVYQIRVKTKEEYKICPRCGENIASVCKSSICNMIKKSRTTINKLRVRKICIDDFAIKNAINRQLL